MKHKLYKIHLSRNLIRGLIWLIFAIFFCFVGLPLLFFYYLFDAEQVKHMLIKQFNHQNYSVVINGSAEPRSWHGLSLFIANLSVTDLNKHEVLHINTVNCQLSWWDLIFGHYKVRRIALNGVTVYQPSNSNQYKDLFNNQNIKNSEFGNLRALSINNLNWVGKTGQYIIRDAKLYFNNLDQSPTFNIRFNSEKFASNVEINGILTTPELQHNLLIPQLTTKINMPQWQVELQSNGHYDYDKQQLVIESSYGVVNNHNYNGNLTMENLKWTIDGVSMQELNLILNANQKQITQELRLNATNLASSTYSDLTIQASKYKYNLLSPDYQLQLNANLAGSKIESELNINNQRCNFAFNLTNSHYKKASFNGNLSGNCSYKYSQHWLGLQLQGKIDQSQANLNLQLHQNKQNLINLIGNFERLDLSKFTNNNSNPNNNLASVIPLYANNDYLPLEWIKNLNLDSQLTIKQVDFQPFSLNNVITKMRIESNMLTLNKLQANLYDGIINGSGHIALTHDKHYNIQFSNQIKHINLQKMLNNIFAVSAINGNADAVINAKFNNIQNYHDLYAKLNGQIALTVNNGGFSGVDFSLFFSPENLAAFQQQTKPMTKFTTLSANFVFESGISQNSNLNFSSPNILAKGHGIIDFQATQLNYNLKISSILPHNNQHISSVSIPVLINGNLFSPKITIQNMTLNKVDPNLSLFGHQNTQKTASKTESVKPKEKAKAKLSHNLKHTKGNER